MRCCYGRSSVLQYSCSSDIALTLAKILIPKLEEKGGAKSTLWFPNAGGIPIQLGRLDCCLLTAAGAVQSKGNGDLNLVISVCKLSSVLRECGKKGALSVFPPCIHFGTVAVFEVVLSCRKLRGRLRAVCVCAMPVCTKSSPKTKPSIILELGNGAGTIALLNASICFFVKTLLWVA